MNYIVFNSPIGEIKVVEDQEKIIEIKFVKDEKVINPESGRKRVCIKGI